LLFVLGSGIIYIKLSEQPRGARKMEKYRFDHQTGSVYQYDASGKTYIFCGNLNGRSEEDFIRDRDERELFDDSED